MIVPVQQTPGVTSGGTTALSDTFPNSPSIGNGIVVCIGSTSREPTSVTDTLGNTYVKRVTATFFTSPYANIWDCVNPTFGGSANTVTANFASSTSASLIAMELPGPLSVNASNTNAANATNATAGAITTTIADTIAFGVLKDNTITAVPAGFTTLYAVPTNTFSCAYEVFTSTQAGINPAWTNTIGGYGCVIAAYSITPADGGQGVSQGLALGAGSANEDGFHREPFVQLGFSLGSSGGYVEAFDNTTQGILFQAAGNTDGDNAPTVSQGIGLGSAPTPDQETIQGIALGNGDASFFVLEQFDAGTAGFSLGSRPTSDTGELANGRYRR